jgi:cell volume regulation protein A
VRDVEPFGVIIGVVAAVVMVAVLSNRISERIRVPAPAIFLVAAAVVSDLVPALSAVSVGLVQRTVTLALIPILFDGGMHIGWRRLRSAAGAVAWIGVAGTFVTAAAVAVLAHLLFGFGWLPAMLIGTALAPTDPAVVFSVLGRREITGRSGVILEGESGANDPVGIALLASILAAAAGTAGLGGAVALGVGEFLLQMGVGAAVGLVGGFGLLVLTRRVPLPNGALYPLRTLAGAAALYGLATIAHGSGFLAVFVAGILLGDARVPFKADIERVHASLASLGEIVAFIMLGLTISLRTLPNSNAWLIGLVLAVLLTLLIRPLCVGLLIWPIRLARGERLFVLWSGLKGAVPILLGTFIITAHQPDAPRIYHIIFVVVAFSVIVQGGLVPTIAARLGVPMRRVEPTPFTAGIRLRYEPRNLYRYQIAPGAPADGATIASLPLQDAWITLLARDGQLLNTADDTTLQAGDELLLQTEPGTGPPPNLFTGPRT